MFICFCGEIRKITIELSSVTPLISSSGVLWHLVRNSSPTFKAILTVLLLIISCWASQVL